MRLLLVFLSLCFLGTVHAQDSIAAHYKIYNVKSKQLISVDKIVTDMNNADVLFLVSCMMIAWVMFLSIKFLKHCIKLMETRLL